MNGTFTLTETTCSEACWHAREEVCRCSCGGKNHGCLKVEGGTQPDRTAIVDGVRYVLKAFGPGVEAEARTINEAAGIKFYGAATARKHWGYTPLAIVRKASANQVAKWPELASERERTAGMHRWQYAAATYLLWVRVDGKGGPKMPAFSVVATAHRT